MNERLRVSLQELGTEVNLTHRLEKLEKQITGMLEHGASIKDASEKVRTILNRVLSNGVALVIHRSSFEAEKIEAPTAVEIRTEER